MQLNTFSIFLWLCLVDLGAHGWILPYFSVYVNITPQGKFRLLFFVDAYAKLQLRKFKSRNIISLIVSLIILSPFVNYISNIYP